MINPILTKNWATATWILNCLGECFYIIPVIFLCHGAWKSIFAVIPIWCTDERLVRVSGFRTNQLSFWTRYRRYNDYTVPLWLFHHVPIHYMMIPYPVIMVYHISPSHVFGGSPNTSPIFPSARSTIPMLMLTYEMITNCWSLRYCNVGSLIITQTVDITKTV